MAKPTDGLTPYSTESTFQACYIRAIGGKLVGLDRTNPKSINFNFALTLEQVELANLYPAAQGSVIPLAMEVAHKAIMRMIKDPNSTQPEDH